MFSFLKLLWNIVCSHFCHVPEQKNQFVRFLHAFLQSNRFGCFLFIASSARMRHESIAKWLSSSRRSRSRSPWTHSDNHSLICSLGHVDINFIPRRTLDWILKFLMEFPLSYPSGLSKICQSNNSSGGEAHELQTLFAYFFGLVWDMMSTFLKAFIVITCSDCAFVKFWFLFHVHRNLVSIIDKSYK